MSEVVLEGNLELTAQTELAPINGLDLFVRTVGDGPTVVALHGGPSASHISLLPAFDDLARGRRLRYYDQRGCGESPAPPGMSLHWQQHVDDLAALLDHWGGEGVALVGHSWGALLSLLFAVQHPTLVRALALITPASITADGRELFLRRLACRMSEIGVLSQQRALLQSKLRRSDPDSFRKKAFELTLAPYLKVPHMAADIAPFKITHRVREAVWRSLGEYDLTDAVSKLSVPAIVVHGRFDPIPLESSTKIASLLDAPLEIFEDSGHMPFLEERERFFTVVDEFLMQQG